MKEQRTPGVDPLVRSVQSAAWTPVEVKPRRFHMLVEACFRRPLVLLSVVVAGMLLTALTVWISPRRYEASVQLFLQPSQAAHETPTADAPAQPLTDIEMHSVAELMRSDVVLRGALNRIDGKRPGPATRERALEQLRRRISVTAIPQTDVLEVQTSDRSPQRAEETVRAMVDSFVDQQLAMLRPESGQAIRDAAVEQQKGRLQAAQDGLLALRKEVSGTHSGSGHVAETASLQHAAAEAQRALDAATQQRDEAAVDDALRRDRWLNVAAAAHPVASGDPVEPTPAVLWPVGAVLSLLAGVACCAWAERRRDTVMTPAELDALTGTVTLAVIPLHAAHAGSSAAVRIAPEMAPARRAASTDETVPRKVRA